MKLNLYEWELVRTWPPFLNYEGLVIAKDEEQAKELIMAEFKYDRNMEQWTITVNHVDLEYAEARVLSNNDWES